jgi:hypothetical protein
VSRLVHRILQPLLTTRVLGSVLYERLAQLPPAEPRAHDEHVGPALQTQPYPPPLHMPREPPAQLSQRDIDFQEYLRANPNGEVSVVPGPDGRPIPVIQASSGAGRTHAFIHSSGRHDDRALPPLAAMSPGHRHTAAHGPPLPYAPVHAGAAVQAAARGRPTSSHSQSSRLSPPPTYPLHGTAQYTTHAAPAARSARPSSPSGYAGAGHRIHNHQRIGPGTNINLDEWERQREERHREREREHEREHERLYATRHVVPPADYARRRSVDESVRYTDSSIPAAAGARADGEPPYRASPVYAGTAAEDVDVSGPSSRIPYSADSRGPPPPAVESRKRPRADVDMDGADRPSVTHAAPPSHAADEERSEKRAHTESDEADSRSISKEAQEVEAMDADD